VCSSPETAHIDDHPPSNTHGWSTVHAPVLSPTPCPEACVLCAVCTHSTTPAHAAARGMTWQVVEPKSLSNRRGTALLLVCVHTRRVHTQGCGLPVRAYMVTRGCQARCSCVHPCGLFQECICIKY
jgi:hypothetical protein